MGDSAPYPEVMTENGRLLVAEPSPDSFSFLETNHSPADLLRAVKGGFGHGVPGVVTEVTLALQKAKPVFVLLLRCDLQDLRTVDQLVALMQKHYQDPTRGPASMSVVHGRTEMELYLYDERTYDESIKTFTPILDTMVTACYHCHIKLRVHK